MAAFAKQVQLAAMLQKAQSKTRPATTASTANADPRTQRVPVAGLRIQYRLISADNSTPTGKYRATNVGSGSKTSGQVNSSQYKDIYSLVKAVQNQKRAQKQTASDMEKSPTKQAGQHAEPPTGWRLVVTALETCYRSTGMKHLMFLVVIFVYAAIGAAIFEAIEAPNEKTQRLALVQKLNQSAFNISNDIAAIYGDQNRAKKEKVRQIINLYQKESKLQPKPNLKWDFWNALFYAGTIFTTIGYGHIACSTTEGRLATMVYALLGIPLLLATLQDLGKVLTRSLKKVWTALRRCVRHWQHKRRRKLRTTDKIATAVASKMSFGIASPVDNNQLDKNREAGAGFDSLLSPITDKDEDETSSSFEEFDFPLPIGILIFIFWTLICAAIFCIWEKDWDYFVAIYFFFISLTTIGLGDIVPNHPRYMIIAFPLVIVGLSLISMCIQLIQQKMAALKEEAFDMIEEQLGIESDESSSESEGEGGKSRGAKESKERSHEHVPYQASLGIFQGSNAGSVNNADEDPSTKTHTRQAVNTWLQRAKRKRRGVQTDESFVSALKQEMRRRFPDAPFEEAYFNVSSPRRFVKSSSDDVNSLLQDIDWPLK